MKRHMHGMTLVELMLALVLGSLVVATAIGLFIANRKTMTMSQGIGQLQQGLHMALELLAHELRHAGHNPCSQQIPLGNAIRAPASRWWTDLQSQETGDDLWSVPWRNTLRGLSTAELATGSGAGARVAGSDAIEIVSAEARAVTVATHDGDTFMLNTSAHGFSSGNLLLVCDPRQASVFQGTVSGTRVTHPAGDMNCSAHLGLGGCDAEPFHYAPPALIARWMPQRWYLGHNGRGGTSLYRMNLDSHGRGVTRQEMVDDVSALEFQYLLAGGSAPVRLPAVGGQWERVVGVQIKISVTAPDITTDDGHPVTRTATHTVNLRSRMP